MDGTLETVDGLSDIFFLYGLRSGEDALQFQAGASSIHQEMWALEQSPVVFTPSDPANILK